MSTKRTVKVIFKDETKRFKIEESYRKFMNAVSSSFDSLPQTIKFFYLDEDGEVISVSSDYDLKEALDSDESSTIKFVIADN